MLLWKEARKEKFFKDRLAIAFSLNQKCYALGSSFKNIYLYKNIQLSSDALSFYYDEEVTKPLLKIRNEWFDKVWIEERVN